MHSVQPPPIAGTPTATARRMEQARQVLAGSRIGQPDHEQALDTLRALAREPDGVQAQWLLGTC
jgi:hypothetical protein